MNADSLMRIANCSDESLSQDAAIRTLARALAAHLEDEHGGGEVDEISEREWRQAVQDAEADRDRLQSELDEALAAKEKAEADDPCGDLDLPLTEHMDDASARTSLEGVAEVLEGEDRQLVHPSGETEDANIVETVEIVLKERDRAIEWAERKDAEIATLKARVEELEGEVKQAEETMGKYVPFQFKHFDSGMQAEFRAFIQRHKKSTLRGPAEEDHSER